MKTITLSKIDSLINDQSCQNESLSDINIAISELSKIIDIEKVRKNQITHSLNEESLPTVTTNLQNHLSQIKNNIKNLNSFMEILFSKKILIEKNTFDINSVSHSVKFS